LKSVSIALQIFSQPAGAAQGGVPRGGAH
jgi:hypothetical protein